MSSSWLYLFILGAGVLQAAGTVMNAQLRCYLVNAWLASFVSFILIALFFASMFAILPRPLPSKWESTAAAFRTISAAEGQAVATFPELRVRLRPRAEIQHSIN
jgi:transporter family-2 protein